MARIFALMLRFATLILIASALGACASDSPRAPSIVVDTLLNGATLVRNIGDGVWADGTGWTAEEILTLGGLEGEGPEQFGEVWDVTLDDDGRLYVLEHQPVEVRVFDVSTGAHVRTFGRAGRGPGELLFPNGFAWDQHGRLWVSDPHNARFSGFDTDGSFVDSRRRELMSYGVSCDCAFDDEGRTLTLAMGISDENGGGVPWFLFTTPPAGGAALDTVAIGHERPLILRVRIAQGHLSLPMPFRMDFVKAIDRGLGVWTGVGSTYRLTRTNTAGDTVLVVERDVPADPVTATDRDAAARWLHEIAEERGGNVDPGLLDIPETKSFFTHVLTDDQGYLWVQRRVTAQLFPPRDAVFDVFSPDGVFQGQIPVDVAVPPVPRVRGELLVGVRRGELDVSEVVVFRIRGR